MYTERDGHGLQDNRIIKSSNNHQYSTTATVFKCRVIYVLLYVISQIESCIYTLSPFYGLSGITVSSLVGPLPLGTVSSVGSPVYHTFPYDRIDHGTDKKGQN